MAQGRSEARVRVGDSDRDTEDDDALFTYADGRPIRPEYLSHRFRTLTGKLGLPPIRLHDLRHCAASLALNERCCVRCIIRHVRGTVCCKGLGFRELACIRRAVGATRRGVRDPLFWLRPVSRCCIRCRCGYRLNDSLNASSWRR